MNLIFATKNKNKALEVHALLRSSSIKLHTLEDYPDLAEPPEDFDTFADNALAKARFVYKYTGIPTIADDSGLEVAALGGRPGVHSKRYSPQATDTANNALLLQELAGITDRRAQFRCLLALVSADFEGTVEGVCAGHITHALTGSSGFGYDPLFSADDLGGRTLAQASLSEKNAISHRGRAFAQLHDLLSRAGLS